MTLREAYLKVKALNPAYPFLWVCRDFGKFWGFFFAPVAYDPDNPVGGSAYDTVNKETGELGFLSGPQAVFWPGGSVELPLEQFKKWDIADALPKRVHVQSPAPRELAYA